VYHTRLLHTQPQSLFLAACCCLIKMQPYKINILSNTNQQLFPFYKILRNLFFSNQLNETHILFKILEAYPDKVCGGATIISSSKNHAVYVYMVMIRAVVLSRSTIFL
jgi:hypothetical protein